MALPGFTAEASVGPTTQVYHVRDRYGTAGGVHLYPQSNGAEWGEGLDAEAMDMVGEDEETMDMAGEDEEDMDMVGEDEETMDMVDEEVEVGDEV